MDKIKCQGCGWELAEGDDGARFCVNMDCDWDECPGCDFEGHMKDHVEDAGSNFGFGGEGFWWVNFKCGYSEAEGGDPSVLA